MQTVFTDRVAATVVASAGRGGGTALGDSSSEAALKLAEAHVTAVFLNEGAQAVVDDVQAPFARHASRHDLAFSLSFTSRAFDGFRARRRVEVVRAKWWRGYRKRRLR